MDTVSVKLGLLSRLHREALPCHLGKGLHKRPVRRGGALKIDSLTLGNDTPMAITVSKLIAVVIALGYFVTAVVVKKPGVSEGVMLFLVLLVPLALIWFPQMGSSWPRKMTVLYTYEDSFGSRRRPLRDSHPGMVAFMGWFFLLGLPIIFYFTWR